MKPLWEFTRHGESGIPVSRLFPNVTTCVDDLCIIRSMVGEGVDHGAALLQTFTGTSTFVRPSMGAWTVYGLGTENSNLPGFVTICPSMGNGGPRNWSNAFLPAVYQGTAIGRSGQPVSGASIPNLTNSQLSPVQQQQQYQFLQTLNNEQLQASTPGDTELEAVINSYQLAFNSLRHTYDVMREALVEVMGEELRDLAAYRQIAGAVQRREDETAADVARALMHHGSRAVLELLTALEQSSGEEDDDDRRA